MGEGEKRSLIILMKRYIKAVGIPLQRESAATGETNPGTYDNKKNLQKIAFPIILIERII